MNKFCVNCCFCECNYEHHSKIKKWWDKVLSMQKYYKCCRDYIRTPMPKDNYLVTGAHDPIDKDAIMKQLNFCSTERDIDNLCGSEAKYFQEVFK